jgi:hypothetical protein
MRNVAQAWAATARTSTFSSVTAPGTADLTCSLMWLAASSDSYMIIVSPVLSLIVQYPVTNPGVCEAQGTSALRLKSLAL